MNLGIIFNVLGGLLRFLGLIMAIPLFVAIYYGESPQPFVFAVVITGVTGFLLSYKYHAEGDWKKREGFAIVAFGWLAAALFGSIPFMLDGIAPINAIFESMSGFTTTGATVLIDLESHSRSILFWRSMTQWIGGMGIIMLFIAILPKLGVAGRQLFRAEAPGPTEDKIRPRIRETAKILWMVYVIISAIEVAVLMLAGMNGYDAVTHTFTTMACGGFSPYAASVAEFQSPLIEGIITLFMFIAGANFALHYKTLYSNHKSLLEDNEFKFYLLIVTLATFLLTLSLWRNMGDTLATSFRYAIFQVVSIVTTTGYATVDFDLWADSSKMVLLSVMFIGGCAGSTAGGIKVIRIQVLLKKGLQELYRLLHPRAVKKIKINQKVVSEAVSTSILGFFFLYIVVFVIVSIVLTYFGIDIISSISAVASTLGNIGPGMELVGPLNSYLPMPDMVKILLSFCMIMGRLEIYTILVFLFMDWDT